MNIIILFIIIIVLSICDYVFQIFARKLSFPVLVSCVGSILFKACVLGASLALVYLAFGTTSFIAHVLIIVIATCILRHNENTEEKE